MPSAGMAFEEIVASVEATMRAATPIRSQPSGPADSSSWAEWPRRLKPMTGSVTLGEPAGARHAVDAENFRGACC
jgi:hypothetical protein